jgi:aldehyde:ferredoxin oxidoreductase
MHERAGRILKVDLSSGASDFCASDPGFTADWLGGRGFGTALLADFAGGTAFLPEMPLIFATGALTGSGLPMSGLCTVTGCSPMTGGIITLSSGGQFSTQLGAAGIDALVIAGRSVLPVILEISPAEVKIRPADRLWGLSCHDVFDCLDSKGGVAAIGPAGESGVRYATIETRHGESFDRGGLGAVLGNKGVKAIHVTGGQSVCPVADQSGFEKARQDMMRLLRASPFLYGPFGIREKGSSAVVDLLFSRGMLPGRNFQKTLDAGVAMMFNSASVNNRFIPLGYGCADCQVACKRKDQEGLSLPDYDPLAAFGAILGTGSLDAAVDAVRSCQKLGLDPVSTAGTLACWSELSGEQISDDQLPVLLSAIAARTGVGELLSMGACEVALVLGDSSVAMAVKGLELPPYDPRASCGLALAYAVSPHGGTHLPAWPIASEVLRKPVPTDPASFDGKARIVAMAEEANAAMDCMVFCRYASAAIELEEAAALYTAASGESCTSGDLKGVGRKILQAERAFNSCNGISPSADGLPDRFFKESAGCLPALDRQAFSIELERYHNIRNGVRS